jgi:hypothetical protein
MSTLNACMALALRSSQIADYENRSGVFYKLSAMQLLMAFLGMSFGSYMLRVNVWTLSLVGISVLSLMIPTTLLFPEPKVPTKYVRSESSSTDSQSSNSPFEQNSENSSLLSHEGESQSQDSTFKTIFHGLTTNYTHSLALFKSIFYSSTLSRTTLFIYFLSMIGLGLRVIFAQWTSITFKWILADVNAITSFEMIVSGVLLLSLPTVSQHYLKPRLGGSTSNVDIFVTKASIIFAAVGILCMGFAPSRVTYILAVTTFTLGSAMDDSLRSFVTGLMENKEAVQQLYIGIGMVSTVGGMLATAVWTGVFSKVLGMGSWLVRIPFVVCSAILLTAFVFVCVLGRFNRSSSGAFVAV